MRGLPAQCGDSLREGIYSGSVLVNTYSNTTKDNQRTNKDVVSTLASLFISDKIRFPCLFPSATRIDLSDPRRGYESSIEPKEYQLAVEIM